MIVISSETHDDDTATHPGFVAILERFMALLEDGSQVQRSELGKRPKVHFTPNPAWQVNFELTPIGGDLWERVAKPDWSRLLIERSDFEVADFYSVNRDLLTAYMGWFAEINEARILPDTVEWRTRADSEIVYWKKLSLVHHAFCRLEVKAPTNTPKWL
jgi:hypothetical protein